MKAGALFIFLLLSCFCFSAIWEQKADFAGIARHRTTMLTIGNKIYIGLGHYNGAGPNILFDDWWEYDPATNSWSQKADYLGGDCYHAAGFTIDDIAYVGTGRTSSTGSVLVQDFFKYDITTNTWTQINSFPGSGRRGAVSFVIDGMAYVGTGEHDGGRTKTFYKFDPTTETWTQITSLAGSSRTSSVGFSIGDYGYVGTGDISGGCTNDFWRYDPSTDVWEEMAPASPTPRQEATGFVVAGKGYIGTGLNDYTDEDLRDFWSYEPTTNSWTRTVDFPGTARRYFSSTNLGDIAYCCMGTNGINFKDFWRFDRTASIHESMDRIQVKTYPNPTNDILHVEIDQETIEQFNQPKLIVTSMAGSIAIEEKLTTNHSTDVSHLAGGVYIYHIRVDQKNIHTGQITIQK